MTQPPGRPDILCIGSFLWDVIGRTGLPVPPGADLPGRIARQPGGVALNIAAALARAGMRPAVLSAVGGDEAGAALVAAAARLGIDCRFLHRMPHRSTDSYVAIEGPEGLVAAIADAGTLEDAGAAILAPLADVGLTGGGGAWTGPAVLDGNLTEALLADIARLPRLAAADLRVVPASPGKAGRLAPLLGAPHATLYLNRAEAAILAGTACPDAPSAAEALLGRGARRVIVTDGPHPAADGLAGGGIVTARPPAVAVRRVTGAGDAFMAGHLVADRAGAGRAGALAAGLAAAAAHIAEA
ncbi:MAG: PfkB family carbohydrate kinase [Rhodobacteraceae bacterium]|nr:PfkB family carbohydrate kinase [Paracoccaceae bacterium]